VKEREAHYSRKKIQEGGAVGNWGKEFSNLGRGIDPRGTLKPEKCMRDQESQEKKAKRVEPEDG